MKARPGNSVRIVGGEFRSRLLRFPDLPGLRPTPDRVRETLFNWLQPWLPGARCLDLFAGSGALGLEAASRGAGQVTLIDRERRAVAALREHLTTLDLAEARVIQADALDWLAGTGGPFDLVFLDPPFAEPLLTPALRRLAERGWLADGALVYFETSANAPPPDWPAGFVPHKEQRAGAVLYGLRRWRAADAGLPVADSGSA